MINNLNYNLRAFSSIFSNPSMAIRSSVRSSFSRNCWFAVVLWKSGGLRKTPNTYFQLRMYELANNIVNNSSRDADLDSTHQYPQRVRVLECSSFSIYLKSNVKLLACVLSSPSTKDNLTASSTCLKCLPRPSLGVSSPITAFVCSFLS